MCDCVECRRLDAIYGKAVVSAEEREQDDIIARWHSGGR